MSARPGGGGWQDPGEAQAQPRLAFPRLTSGVKWLLLANGALFLVQFGLFLSVDPGLYDRVLRHVALDPTAFVEHFPFVPIWQLVTYGFLHDIGSLGHIFGNMLMLYFFGTMLEDYIGTRRFLVHYALALLTGAALFLAIGIAGRSTTYALGASGACLGVMVAMATLRPRQTVFLLFIPILLKWLAIGVLVVDVFGALHDMKQGGNGTAHFVHLGGIAYGFLAVRLAWIYKDPIETLERKRAVREVERTADDEVRMDQLLDKIHREGMSSLTRTEREFLKRASSRR